MSNNIGYHTRLYSDNKIKVCGGSFGGTLDLDTANRLVSCQFDVVVKPSGTAVFVDHSGREVRLYLSVDPIMTIKGVESVKAWRHEKARQEEAEALLRETQREELDAVMSGLSHDEIIRRLSKEK